MTKAVPFPPILQLDTSATTLLDVLVELGHLDDAMLTHVNQALGVLEKPLDADAVGIITLDDVRRVAASVVFDRIGTLDGETRRMIEREWGMLFY